MIIMYFFQGLVIPEEIIHVPEANNYSDPELTVQVSVRSKISIGNTKQAISLDFMLLLLQLKTNMGNIHRVIPVKATLVDKSSPEARAPPFASTFHFQKKTLYEVLLEKYVKSRSEAIFIL